MRIPLGLSILLLSMLLGCRGESVPNDITWIETDLVQEELTLSLGYRGAVKPGSAVEPVAALRMGGIPVDNAMVFNSLITTGTAEVLDEEIATVYEPDAGIYGRGSLQIPADSTACLMRFRIVLPDHQGEVVQDVALQGL